VEELNEQEEDLDEKIVEKDDAYMGTYFKWTM